MFSQALGQRRFRRLGWQGCGATGQADQANARPENATERAARVLVCASRGVGRCAKVFKRPPLFPHSAEHFLKQIARASDWIFANALLFLRHYFEEAVQRFVGHVTVYVHSFRSEQ